MPKQGGQGKGKPKMVDRELGKALMKKQIVGLQGLNGAKTSPNINMMSILDNSALDDYIITAEMDTEDVEVKRVNHNDSFLVEVGDGNTIQSMSVKEFSYQHLIIPRKPRWNSTMTAEEVDFNEKKSFLQWRRDIAALECGDDAVRKVTPFEKNLDVWRQLWRAVERSEIVVQIVDARNPLLYFTNDLMTYVREHQPPKPLMLLINKADYLTDYHRSTWVDHLNSLNVQFIFYSAKSEQVKLDEGNMNSSESINVDNVSLLVKYATLNFVGDENGCQQKSFHSENEQFKSLQGSVLTRSDLLYFFELLCKSLNASPQQKHRGRYCIGMVGYPNVGKSSVINTLLGVSKNSHGSVRVGVSSTPGKTKHLQTLELSSAIMLCDCPGLVFPSFMNSTAEMICAGILPINQMRDYVEPAKVIASRVPCRLLEAAYGMRILREIDFTDDPDRPPTAHELLCAYCLVKGYVTNGTGRWDEFRACKELLRDFNDGKILYVAPPYDISKVGQHALERWLFETETIMMKRPIVAERILQRISNSSGVTDEIIVEENVSEIVSSEVSKREHKKMKHWGKKNKKLRDKNPYSDDNGTESYVIRSRDRHL